MDKINVLVLPGLAVCIAAGMAVLGWLIFRPEAIVKTREESPKTRRKMRKAL